MWKLLILGYGIVSYLVFFLTFLYAIGFVGNIFIPKTIDSGTDPGLIKALIINTILLGQFAIQHSVMARPAFKKWWTTIVPQAAERSTYVLISSVSLIILFSFWQPMTDLIWHFEEGFVYLALLGLFWSGWIIVLLSTFMINHFDLFGLRQVFFYFTDKTDEIINFKTPFLYKYVRHPIMFGFIIAFWATPSMTTGHLLFAVATSIYIIIGITLEEQDLIAIYGEKYSEYKNKVGMLIPFIK